MRASVLLLPAVWIVLASCQRPDHPAAEPRVSSADFTDSRALDSSWSNLGAVWRDAGGQGNSPCVELTSDPKHKLAWAKSAELEVQPGELVEAQIMVKAMKGTPLVTPQLEWQRQGKPLPPTIGGTPNGAPPSMRPFQASADWRMAAVRALAPNGADKVGFRLKCSGADAAALLDDASLRIVPREQLQGELDRQPVAIDPTELKTEDFVTAKEGALFRRGEKLRIWSAQGNLLGLTHADIDRELDRFQAHGFNGYRSLNWSDTLSMPYTPGDNSIQDRVDYLIAALGRRGINFWCDFLSGCPFKPEDAGGDDAWADAVKEMSGKRTLIVRSALPVLWDPRMQRLYHDYIKKALAHRNPYNGLAYGEDPAFYCWELSNEDWFIFRVLWGNHLKLPAYFQRGLYTRWNQWLRDKYHGTAELQAAWGGLREGESLEQGEVKLLPLQTKYSQSDLAKAMGLNVEFQNAKLAPEDFSKQRGADVVEFLTKLYLDFKLEAAKVFRAQGRPGIGCRVVPLLFDTGYSGSVLTAYAHSFSDAVAVASYQDMSVHSPCPTFPFASGLRSPPSLNGWLDNRKVAGKPTFIYENMIFAPQKYRAEYFYRVMALAALQDYSVVDFHYYGHPWPYPMENIQATIALPSMIGTNNTYGLLMRNDEVLMGAVRAAGEIFKHGYLRALPAPVQATLGRGSLWNFNTGGKYEAAANQTVFRKGFQWAFDPNRQDDEVKGALVTAAEVKAEREARPSKQLAYRWREGYMLVDTPEAKALVGFAPDSFRYEDGVSFEDIAVRAPAAMPFQVPGERYVALGVVSTDGKPLAQSRRILVSAVNTSFNTGMAIDADLMRQDKAYSYGLSRSITNRGSAPVLVGRPSLTLKAPWLRGLRFKMSDYSGNILRQGVLEASALDIPGDLPVHATELERE